MDAASGEQEKSRCLWVNQEKQVVTMMADRLSTGCVKTWCASWSHRREMTRWICWLFRVSCVVGGFTEHVQGGEGQNPNGGPPFFLAQKRWSSLSELTAFFQDLGNDGESNRTSTITLPDQNNQTGEYIDVFAREPRRPRTINGTLTTLLVEQATGQAGGGDGGRGRRESEDGPDKAVPRASIHMLMHAMAAVDAASDEGDDDGVKNLARL